MSMEVASQRRDVLDAFIQNEQKVISHMKSFNEIFVFLNESLKSMSVHMVSKKTNSKTSYYDKMHKEVTEIETKLQNKFSNFGRINETMNVYLGKIKKHINLVKEVKVK